MPGIVASCRVFVARNIKGRRQAPARSYTRR
jgi:hypothetical protein